MYKTVQINLKKKERKKTIIIPHWQTLKQQKRNELFQTYGLQMSGNIWVCLFVCVLFLGFIGSIKKNF